jgi:hypothetical protein
MDKGPEGAAALVESLTNAFFVSVVFPENARSKVTDGVADALGECLLPLSVDFHRCACPTLQSVTFHHCSRITNAAAISLAACTALERVSLDGCATLTDAGAAPRERKPLMLRASNG